MDRSSTIEPRVSANGAPLSNPLAGRAQRWAARAFLAFGLLLVGGRASAQDAAVTNPDAGANVTNSSTNVTLSLTSSDVSRSDTFLRDGNALYYVSQADCLDSTASFTFQVRQNAAALTLQVWAAYNGIDCRLATSRSGTGTLTTVCTQIPVTLDPNASGNITVKMRDIANVVFLAAPSTIGDLSNCKEPTGTDITNFVTLYFMRVGGASDIQAADAATFNTQVDLIGPSPPTNVVAGVGDKRLILSYDQSTGLGVTDYRVYCDAEVDVGALTSDAASPATTTSSSTSGTGTGGGGTGGAAGTGGAGGAGGAGGTNGTGGAGGTGAGTTTSSTTSSGVASSSSSSSSGDNADGGTCVATNLTAGVAPAATRQQCISADTTEVSNISTTTPLVNGKAYAVGVAAVDEVGNVGALSQLACEMPEPVGDFWSQYVADHGMAGNGCGLCSVGVAGGLAWPPLVGGTAMALLLVARRRKRSSALDGARGAGGSPRGNKLPKAGPRARSAAVARKGSEKE